LLDRETQDARRRKRWRCFVIRARNGLVHSRRVGRTGHLVFAGGIGENAPTVRTWICEGLGFLGIELQGTRYAANEGVISTAASWVAVRVIRTDEAQMIVRSVIRVLGLG
jgi:acetate kinase